MPDEPISNPGVTPTPEVPPYGPEKPRLGENEEAQEPKPFALPPEPPTKQRPGQAAPTDKPTPMEVARERSQQPMLPEQLSDHIDNLKNRLGDVQTKLQNPSLTSRYTQDHLEAINRVLDKFNPDMRTIARYSEGEFNPPQKTKGESILEYASRWIDGSQETLSQALDFLSKEQTPNPAAFLQLQFGVQRAVQRGELFASIVGASVSGIKTILSTQLG